MSKTAMSKKARGMITLFASILLVLVGLVLPTPASATSYYFGINQIGSIQGFDTLIIKPQQMCSNAVIGTQTVETIITDANSNQWLYDIATTDSSGNWSTSKITVNPYMPYGEILIDVRCRQGSVILRNYERQSTYIYEQESRIVASGPTIIGEWVTFSSTSGNGCTPNTLVNFEIYGTQPNNSYGTISPLSWGSTLANSSGDWELAVGLSATVYDQNGFYFLRMSCADWSNSYYSYRFMALENEYVAMGDSYSAGLGSSNYYSWSTECKKSYDAYAHDIATTLGLSRPDLAACAGATTYDIHNPRMASSDLQPAQVDHLGENTETVTLTIGGNDVGFADVVRECTNYPTGAGIHYGYGCASNTGLVNTLTARLNALDGGTTITDPSGHNITPIEDVLRSIADKAPNAEIYIGGYPYLFGDSGTNFTTEGNAPGGKKCVVWNVGSVEASVALWDAQWLNDKADELNAVISDAVDAVQPLNVTYVPPATFTGHGLCDSSSSYINGVILSGTTLQPETFHPNYDGIKNGYGDSFDLMM